MIRKFALMALAGATLLASPASAQLYGDPFSSIRPGQGRQAPPPPGYEPRQRYQAQPDNRGYDRGYDDRRRYDRGRGYDDGPRYPRGGARYGDFCATSRGPCQTRPQPVGTSCRCQIDGLTKRGIIQ